MPPKKGEPPPAMPDLEDEVGLPEDMSAIEEPNFCLVLGHLAGHSFKVREPQPEPEEGAPPAELPPAKEFDPCSLLIELVKQPMEPLQRQVVLLERDELSALLVEANGLQDKSIWAGLRFRLEKERLARSRAKSNAARREAIAAHEAAKAAREAEEAGQELPPAAEDLSSDDSTGPRVDVLFLLREAPSPEELQEISAEGLCGDGTVNLWAAIYLAGNTLEEADSITQVMCESPELPTMFYKAIHSAPSRSDMANCTVCTIKDSHLLAFAPPKRELADGEEAKAHGPELEPVERVQAAVLRQLASEADELARFRAWVQAADKRQIPNLPTVDSEDPTAGTTEDRLYHRMMNSVDQAYHDVPLFLHCLTDQVERTLSKNAQQMEDEVAMASLKEYLGTSSSRALSSGTASRPANQTGLGVAGEPQGPLLPLLDNAACRHTLGACAKLEGQPVLGSVHKVLAKVSVPGSGRSGLPKAAVHSAAEREALTYRFYPFAPSVPPAELEQMLLLHAFQDLLAKAQPERSWCFADRIWREQIPKHLLGQVLEAALRSEPFVDTAYLPRNDCLLVALHHRSMPGRVMWHKWEGDLLADKEAAKWQSSALTTLPTFNDWAQVFGASMLGSTGALAVPQPKTILENIDGRDLGYNAVVEKLASPPDGSLILVSCTEHGLKQNFPEPSNLPLPQASSRFSAPSRISRRLARVFKDGLTFGIVEDFSWKRWQLLEQAAAVAPDSHKEQPGESEERPASPGGEAEASSMLPFSSARLGLFWLSFPNGARLTTRMHHENALQRGVLKGGGAEMPLPPMGTLLTYSMAAGQVIQVFSDGSVCLSWPAGSAQLEAAKSLCSTTAITPGCAQDFEIVRHITPFGSLIRTLVSGRTEVFHSDGTTATRNPTCGELQQQLDKLRASPGSASSVELLLRMLKVYQEQHEEPLQERPCDRVVAAGIPGHWVVVQPDGKMHGRVDVPSSPTTAVAEPAELVEKGSRPSTVNGEQRPDQPAASTAGVQTLQDILGGVLVDGGTRVEYPIDGVSSALQVDLLTRHKARTNSRGYASFEDPDGTQKVSVHADGTRITRSFKEYGCEIEIYKEPLALMKCEIRDTDLPDSSTDTRLATETGPGLQVTVDCADGTRIQVIPKTMDGYDISPLLPDEQDWTANSAHASVTCEDREGNTVIALGDGQVQILTAAHSEWGYKAHCNEAKLVLAVGESEGDAFVISENQKLTTPTLPGDVDGPPSPRCIKGNKAYSLLDGNATLPEPVLQPRLFVVHGNGDAEEVLPAARAHELLQAAQDDPLAMVVGPQPLADHLAKCQSHTIFKMRLPDSVAVPQMGSVALPEGVDGGASICSVITQASQQASLQASQQSQLVNSGAVTEYRQLIEYPEVTIEDQQKLQGTLKQYRKWEAELLQKNRNAAKPPDPKAGKKKDKGKADKKKEKGKKGKKGRGESEGEDAERELPPEPAFVQNLQLTPFEHHVKVMQGRLAMLPSPTAEDLLSRALASFQAEKAQVGQEARSGAAASFAATEHVEAPGGEDIRGDATQRPSQDAETSQDLGEDSQVDQENVAPANKTAPRRPAKQRQQVAETEFSFSYFKSEQGLQFLMDTGKLDPEAKQLQASMQKEKRARPPPPVPQRTPWNPRLVGEEPDEQEEPEDNEAEEGMEAQWPGHHQGGYASTGTGFAGGHGGQEFHAVMEEGDRMPLPFSPGNRLPIVPEKDDHPVGPHPNKKTALWDVYGEPRTQKSKISQAYTEINAEYLEVEGATDRRVRTAAIAHKKNAHKAPSVQTVRKTGQHVIGMGAELGAKEILGDIALAGVDEHWKLSSTMQGLGDSNQLVEVMPGACRFGPLRLGSLYRMHFYLRNLDVDVTRFNVKPPDSDMVKVHWTPGHLAPGMATKITVEVAALAARKIEQLVEIQVKAHIVRVPVTAKVIDADEYDRLDAESFALHARRIGRHRERSENQKPSPVQLVTDPDYCQKVMSKAYMPAPPEFQDGPGDPELLG
jgi:hypothetical protein